MATTQMSFADVGTLFNTISNELEGGVSTQNQALLVNQVTTVQTQLQGLVDSGMFNNLIDDAGNANPGAVVRVQNIADQMNFLKQEIGAYGGSTFDPKYINDVVRDVQDIVGNDDNLTALAQQGGHAGFQQVSFLLTPATPFADSGAQTTALLQFISDTNSLTERAQTLAGTDPNSADVQQLIADIQTFSHNADAYSTSQGGLFSARFNNEFAHDGVQGTASRELIAGLQHGDANLVAGAVDVLLDNANDVQGNMLTQGNTFTPAPNGGIPANINNVHDAGAVFDDAVTKLIGGVYSGNQQSVVDDLNATQKGLMAAIPNEGITGDALNHVNQVISLLGQESSLVAGVNTATPTQVSDVNGQIGQITAEILNIINNDATLADLANSSDDNFSFVALPQGTSPASSAGGVASTPTTPGTPATPPASGGGTTPVTPPAAGGQGGAEVVASNHDGGAGHHHDPQVGQDAHLHDAHFHHLWG
jgi:hypothetical protein